jgi:2-polyprenyl-3-methyl-5-hydroxy-6-metoxy-1,4-benzoquinol methylase
MKTDRTSIIFPFTGKPHINLTPKQQEVAVRLQNKISSGVYRLEAKSCLCGANIDKVIAETDRYGLKLNTVICTECGLVRTNPRLTEEALSNFYKQEYRDLYMGPEYASMESYFQGMVQRGKYLSDLLRQRLPKISFKGKNVLEIGCSAGGVLVPFLDNGAKVTGYDYDQRYLDYGKKTYPGLDLRYGGILESSQVKEKFDLVIMNHVLEHLADPVSAIKIVEKYLNPGGIMYISVPGIRNPEYYFSPEKSFLGALHIGHLFHFSRNTLMMNIPDFVGVYADNKIRAIFEFKPGIISSPMKDDYQKVICSLYQREASLRGRLSRKLDSVIYAYKNSVVRFAHRKKLLPKSILNRYTS